MHRLHFAKYLLGLFIKPGSLLTWQTFAERPDVAGSRHLTRTWTEPARAALPRLRQLNAAGAGVFMTIQETDGQGRKASNVTRVRALFVDIEDKEPRDWHLEPSMVIETGKGRHAYWCVADDMPLDAFADAQKRLIKRYDADPAVHDLARVMRVPGALHQKGEPVPVTIEYLSPWGMYPWREIVRELPQLPKPKPLPKPPKAETLALVKAAGGAWNRTRVDVTTLRLTALFTDLGMARGEMRDGLPVHCPWADSHSSDTAPTATMVWDGDGTRPAGFKCLHAHCVSRSLRDVLIMYRQHLPAYGTTMRAPSKNALTAASYLED